MKNLKKVIAYTLLFAGIVFLFLAFFPKTYRVPQIEPRNDVQFWQLPTGSRIAYYHVKAKNTAKPYPIVFLQGGPGGFISKNTVKMLSPLAENGFDIYLYDPVGSGYSDRLSDITNYTCDRQVQDLEAIVHQIGTEKVILIGQSWGAMLAICYIADHANEVDKIVLTGPGPIYPIHPQYAAVAPPDSLHITAPQTTNSVGNRKANSIRTQTMAFFATHFGIKIASDKEADDFQTFLNNELNKSTVCDTVHASPAKGGGGYYAGLMTFGSLMEIQDPRPKLKNLQTPLLILKGQCDNQKWGFAMEYLELFPHHKLVVVPNAGHSIAQEQPEKYLEALRAFLIEK